MRSSRDVDSRWLVLHKNKETNNNIQVSKRSREADVVSDGADREKSESSILEKEKKAVYSLAKEAHYPYELCVVCCDNTQSV